MLRELRIQKAHHNQHDIWKKTNNKYSTYSYHAPRRFPFLGAFRVLVGLLRCLVTPLHVLLQSDDKNCRRDEDDEKTDEGRSREGANEIV